MLPYFSKLSAMYSCSSPSVVEIWCCIGTLSLTVRA